MRVLLIHGYSADNAGDGLLVSAALELVREAFGDPQVELLCQYPDSFRELGLALYPSRPDSALKAALRGDFPKFDAFDLIVAVGGGYLRFGHPVEALKTTAVHGYQLVLASMTKTPVIYLPQSIGPLRFGSQGMVRHFAARVQRIHLRDDRSMHEVRLPNTVRTPDMALLARSYRDRSGAVPSATPIVSVRNVAGSVPTDVLELTHTLETFDGYVQSAVGSNQDQAAVESISPRRIVTRRELLEGDERRVVVAVRLHAALMALNAGHLVVHLAYERKGFGAFQDLGLPEYVHNVNDFDPARVHAQVASLLNSLEVREAYDATLREARSRLESRRAALIRDVQSIASLEAL
ncbi:polysaccharide pyruvyl transferase family protein [Serinibacter salmoneus]|uniref:Polysaccharide pyruvyl transferase WcaK-like protein n=1 Tax=Serinibacter salmoneus TaxID=556530 RepID=A0A2A9CY68_9MICO|nr:polysaccharide pyruvyl transferase family protein [Serinibacter salmoneus]PFG19091.1 polysaccharide pyruvyl transferase WcaK-like protein [Serinibacter salmoneus]